MLSAELGAAEGTHELLLAGGAALVLLYSARTSTKDVDAILSDSAARQAARRVAGRLGFPEDWLNEGAKGFLHGVALGDVLLRTPALVVQALAPQQLLAMKLCAWRDDIGIADARLILSKLQGDQIAVWQQLEPYLVPGRELKARYAFEDLWESEHGAS
jgi:hypothetical protein